MTKSASRKFKRYACAVCGRQFGLKSALNRVRRDFVIKDEIVGLCPNCRRQVAAKELAASIREVSASGDRNRG